MINSDLTFDNLFKLGMPIQNIREWQIYLGIIETYFRIRKIENPIIVELGVAWNKQKKHYEELLNYTHIGIDMSCWKNAPKPDIIGDSRDPETVKKLKEKLNGQPINLLFIDGDHDPAVAKKDYELFSPLVKNIIVLHDVVSYKSLAKLWNELKGDKNADMQDRTFITIGAWHKETDRQDIAYGGTGIGMMIIGTKAEREYIPGKGW